MLFSIFISLLFRFIPLFAPTPAYINDTYPMTHSHCSALRDFLLVHYINLRLLTYLLTYCHRLQLCATSTDNVGGVSTHLRQSEFRGALPALSAGCVTNFN